MPAILFALISYLGWAVGDVFGTVATRRLGGYSTTFWTGIISLIVFALYIPFSLNDLTGASINIILLSFFLGILGMLGLISFYEGLKVGPAPLVGTIVSSFAAITVVFSIIFLGERITLTQGLSITIIFIGLILSTLNLMDLFRRRLVVGRGVILALLATFLFGSQFAFMKIPVREIGWFWPIYLGTIPFLALPLFTKIRNIELKHPNYKNALLPLSLSAVLITFAVFSFNIGISKGLVAIIAPIAGSYPTLFVLLAFIFFKDKITKQQILGIITTLAGIVLLSFFSV